MYMYIHMCPHCCLNRIYRVRLLAQTWHQGFGVHLVKVQFCAKRVVRV